MYQAYPRGRSVGRIEAFFSQRGSVEIFSGPEVGVYCGREDVDNEGVIARAESVNRWQTMPRRCHGAIERYYDL